MESKEKIKRSRPDRAKKLEARKTQSETVVKSCLMKYIRCEAEDKKKLKDEIAKRVKSFSRNLYHANVMLSGFIKELYNGVSTDDIHNINIPDVLDTTFIRHLLLGTRTNPLLEEYFIKYPELLNDKESKRHFGDCNIYSFGATKYLTNLTNSLKMNLDKTIKHILKQYQEENNLSVDQRTLMYYKICGWKIQSRHTFRDSGETDEMLNIVKIHRQILGLGDKEEITDKWLKNKTSQLNIIRYFVFINRERKRRNLKLLNIVPISTIKSHFITIDTKVFYGIMRSMELFKGSEIEFRTLAIEQWTSVFDIDKLRGKNKTFTGTIETDGVLLCTHFMRPKNDLDDQTVQSVVIQDSDRVIGIDPGRTNIYFAAEKIDDQVKTYKLTRKQYYQESGIFNARTQTEEWMKNIKDEMAEMATVSLKGDSMEDHKAFIKMYLKHKNTLWNEMTKERWSRQRMRMYGGKKRTFEKFFNKIKQVDETKRVVIAYGSAKFAPGGKNEIAVPTTSAFKECKYRFPIVVVDEFRTTKVHYEDDTILQKVGKKGLQKEVRGLLWCSSTIRSKFVDRDRNAALNIMRCARPEARPISLTRRPGLQAINDVVGKRILVKSRMEYIRGKSRQRVTAYMQSPSVP